VNFCCPHQYQIRLFWNRSVGICASNFLCVWWQPLVRYSLQILCHIASQVAIRVLIQTKSWRFNDASFQMVDQKHGLPNPPSTA
jgi:hypothetical protein